MQYVSLLLVVMAGSSSCVRASISKPDLQSLDEDLERVRDCHGMPALTTSVIVDGVAVHEKAYGLADVERDQRATEHTAFCIGSLTKGFTATLIAKLMDSKLINISWDTPIRDVLGESFHLSDATRTAHTSLRDLLAHKMGVPPYFMRLRVGYPADTTRAEFVKKIRYMCPTKPFRTEFLYNNYMYALAGYVLEVLTGHSWEELVREHIFDKLGMRDSGFIHQRTESTFDFAKAYVTHEGELKPIDERIVRKVGPAAPAGSIFSSSEDMTKWLRFHLQAARDLHFETNVTEIFHRQIPLRMPMDVYLPLSPVSVVHAGYCLGWSEINYRGYQIFFHTGGISTYTSMLFIIPAINSAAYISTSGYNVRGFNIQRLAFYMMDKLLGLEPWKSIDTICNIDVDYSDESNWNYTLGVQDIDFSHRRNPDGTVSDMATSQDTYVGLYAHPGFGEVEIFFNKTRNKLQMRFGDIGHAELADSGQRHMYEVRWLAPYHFLGWTHPEVADFILTFDDIGNEGTAAKARALLLPIDRSVDTRFVRDFDFSNVDPSFCGGSCMCVPARNMYIVIIVFITASLLPSNSIP